MNKKIKEQEGEMNKVKLAEEIAREVHKGQKRTIGRKEDYIEHPKRVASHFSSEELQIVSWLHDVLEMSELKPIDLIMKKIPIGLVNEVEKLTRLKGHNYLEYILYVKRCGGIAKIIKIADIKDNLEKLPNGSLRDKYLLALHILENN